jgi:hypothetical protein
MMPQPNAAAAAPAPPTGAAQSGAPLVPGGGIDPRLAAAAYLNSKAEIAGLGTPFKSFTDAIINSPSYKAAVAGAEMQGKLPYVGPTAAAEAQGKAPFTWNTLRPGQMGGYGGNMTAAAPVQVDAVDPATGRTYKTWAFPPLPGQNPGQSSMAPGPQAALDASSAPNGVLTKLGPGEIRAAETHADKEQTDRQQVINEANAAQQSRATLLNMSNDAGNFTQGPFAAHYQQAARYLRLIDPSYNGQVASYEDFVKNAGALTRNAVKEASSRAMSPDSRPISNARRHPTPSLSRRWPRTTGARCSASCKVARMVNASCRASGSN